MTTEQFHNVNETLGELKEQFNFQYDTQDNICVELSKDIVLVRFIYKDSIFDMYEVKIPKVKPFTAEYVLERISKKKGQTYTNHTDVFKSLLNRVNDTLESKIKVYATSYGLGVEAIFGSRKENFDDMYVVGGVLETLGVKFSYSASPAEWVRRIVISKSEKNINLIKNL